MSGITDFHAHAFPDELAPRAIGRLEAVHGSPAALDGTVSDLLASMDRAGIERTVVCSIATAPKQVESILRWSLSIRSGRIVPLASVHPDCEDARGLVARIAASGLPGIKLHPHFQDFVVDEPRMWPIYEAAAEHGLLVVLHCGEDFSFPGDSERAHPARVLAMHRRFPSLRLVATHMGGWKQWEAALRTVVGTGLYLESSYSLGVAPDEVLRRILEAHPPERLLFGTDSPWRDQAQDLERVRGFLGDDSLRRLVLVENAERLLSECGWSAA